MVRCSNPYWLVVWNMPFTFPFTWESHHPNWRTDIFQRGRYTTNQHKSTYIYIIISWLIREIIPKWPNYSGQWNIRTYPYMYNIYIFIIFWLVTSTSIRHWWRPGSILSGRVPQPLESGALWSTGRGQGPRDAEEYRPEKGHQWLRWAKFLMSFFGRETDGSRRTNQKGQQLKTGWWFGTWFLFFHSLGNVIIPTDFHSNIFQRGRLKPPTRYIINHH